MLSFLRSSLLRFCIQQQLTKQLECPPTTARRHIWAWNSFSCAKETLYKHAKSIFTLRKSVSHLAQHLSAKFTGVYKLLLQLTGWLLLSGRGRVLLRKSHSRGIQGHWFYTRLKKKKASCPLIGIHPVNNFFSRSAINNVLGRPSVTS